MSDRATYKLIAGLMYGYVAVCVIEVACMLIFKEYVFVKYLGAFPETVTDTVGKILAYVVCWGLCAAIMVGCLAISLALLVPVLFLQLLLWLASLGPGGAIVALAIGVMAIVYVWIEWSEQFISFWRHLVLLWARILVFFNPPETKNAFAGGWASPPPPPEGGWMSERDSNPGQLAIPMSPNVEVSDDLISNLKTRVVLRSQAKTMQEATHTLESYTALAKAGLEFEKTKEEARNFPLAAQTRREALEDQLEEVQERRRQRGEARNAKPSPFVAMTEENERLRLEVEKAKLEEELARARASRDKLQCVPPPPPPPPPPLPFEQKLANEFERKVRAKSEIWSRARYLSDEYPEERDYIMRQAQKEIEALDSQ